MAAPQISTKRIAIDKANTQMVAITAVTAFITVFCLFASKAVLNQNQYQARVAAAKETAHKQLQQNLQAYSQLSDSYKKFDNATTNAIGGHRDGTEDNDGRNSVLILDALPDTYNFPALASTLEKVFTDNSLKVSALSGTDDQAAQQSNNTSATPTPVAMPLTFTLDKLTYDQANLLIGKLQLSIRPIQIDKLTMAASDEGLNLTINAHSYYQPGKSLTIAKKVVK